MSTFAMTIGTAIPVGYNIGVINSPADYIQNWCNQTIYNRYDMILTEDQLQTLWSTIISVFLVGGCVGSLGAATLADKFGRFVYIYIVEKSTTKICFFHYLYLFFSFISVVFRKGSLFICGIMFAIGAVLFYFCRIASSVEMLLFARFIVGLSSGITTAVLAMYLSEIAPSELRGTLATFSGMGMHSRTIEFFLSFFIFSLFLNIYIELKFN